MIALELLRSIGWSDWLITSYRERWILPILFQDNTGIGNFLKGVVNNPEFGSVFQVSFNFSKSIWWSWPLNTYTSYPNSSPLTQDRKKIMVHQNSH